MEVGACRRSLGCTVNSRSAWYSSDSVARKEVKEGGRGGGKREEGRQERGEVEREIKRREEKEKRGGREGKKGRESLLINSKN